MQILNCIHQITFQKKIMMESQDTIDPNNVLKCRLCWEETGTKISPCNCCGSIGYIHEECLKMWISKSLENGTQRASQKQDGYTSVQCELCKGDITFKMVRTPTCLSRKQACERITDGKRSFSILLFVIVTMAIIGIVLLTEAITDLKTDNYTIWGVVFVFTFVLLIILLEARFTYSFINSFFRGNTYQINSFKTKTYS